MNKSKLPYILPKNLPEQLRHLAKITNIPFSFVKDGGQLELEAMSGVILYRHLNRIQKTEAMSLIRQVGNKNKPLEGQLVNLILDISVNPQWGVWSLSNDELLNDRNFHDSINRYAGIIGLTASAVGVKTIIQDTWKRKRMTRGGVVTLVLWGAFLFNSSELEKVNQEITNRSQLKTSPVY
ncbi:hypothetical protein ACM9HF_16705 [Colwellia sp. RE-S-Sl-9]